jgi:hypothetical protein
MYERKKFKIWLHNLEGFDSHLIAAEYDGRELGDVEAEYYKYDDDDDDEDDEGDGDEYTDTGVGDEDNDGDEPYEWRLTAVPSNDQKIKMLKIGCYEFADSLSFQSGSLSSLSDKLIKSRQKENTLLNILAAIPELAHITHSDKTTTFCPERYKLCLVSFFKKKHFFSLFQKNKFFRGKLSSHTSLQRRLELWKL